MKPLTLEELLQNINTLPPIPSLVIHVLELLDDKNSDTRLISDQLACDPALTASILAVCNSGYYSVRQEITSIQMAISYLGRNTIKRILITSLVSRYYQNLPKGYEAYPGQLWEHCIAVAIFAELLGEHSAQLNRDTLFTVGLLHDVGKIVLNSLLHEEYQKVLEITRQNSRPFEEVERELFGFTHGEAGAYLLEKWKMPSVFIDVARHHCSPAPSHAPEVHVVAAANTMARSMGLGTDIYIVECAPDHPLLDKISQQEGMMEDLIARFQQSFQRTSELYRNAVK
ncbi:HDOD domain-containing protein [Desulfurispirillum indicum]|uniref:HDOD domain-containing protein n=1 Tax=Desulfurispirillum indicum TaxID=936456 RepID=UPI001CFBDD0F|nr:HDOD domain-containing protein [Desulfurispirillum indicum]UCZ55925.1 HDOD domain-containing protein [Desulfurispirillum indicum]